MTADRTAYHLGIDLGTTYVAAGTLEQGRPEIITLGDRTPVLPSVLYFREDGDVLTGEAATRRGLSDPTRVVREFKRRVGDTTPVIVGQTPYSVDVLMAKLLRFVHDAVVERQGVAPQSIAITHPANWGPYKVDVLEQAVRIAEIGNVSTITEPVAAAIHYAAAERMQPGETVAVYDLGGGTFDAAVLRKTADDFQVLGEVEGIERLGGIDFDEAVFQHVVRFCEASLAELDIDDAASVQALARLRAECVDAKEVLSTDTEVTIPVVLPNLQTEVRLTRAEFEAMIRPLLRQTVEALQRAIRSAKVEPHELSTVLLVGGCSRIPLIAEMVGAELGRPIAVDRHPKHTVALGAAISAGRSEKAPEPEVDDWFRTDPTTSVPAEAISAVGFAAAAGVADPTSAADQTGESEAAPSSDDGELSPAEKLGTAPIKLPTAAEASAAAAAGSAAASAAAAAAAPAAVPAPVQKPVEQANQAPGNQAPGNQAPGNATGHSQQQSSSSALFPETQSQAIRSVATPAAGDGQAKQDPSTMSFSSDHTYTGGGQSSPSFQQHQMAALSEPSKPKGSVLVLAAAVIGALLLLGGGALALTRSGSTNNVGTTAGLDPESPTAEDGEQDTSPVTDPVTGEVDPDAQNNQGGDQGTTNEGGNGQTDTTVGQTGTTVGNTDTTAAHTDTTAGVTTTQHGDTTTTETTTTETTTPEDTETTETTEGVTETTETTEGETETTETTEEETTETTEAAAMPISIVGGPRINSRNPTSFQFSYTTNDVCGTGKFVVVEKSSGTIAGSFQGANVCAGPVHGGFPNGSATFSGFDLSPGTTYRVKVTVTGTASDGSRTAGTGSDSASFEVTTAE